jgi:protein involved in polysaccharide export with SLBB domain
MKAILPHLLPLTSKLLTNYLPNRFLVLPIVAIILALTACKSPSYSESTHQKTVVANSETNLLREGDLVSISFQNSTNLNTAQKIPLDGLLNLEIVGVVKAAGKTPEEFQAELTQLYASLTKNDPITVKLLVAATGVYVSGAVFHPGRIPMERPMTAFEAVMEAGGFDPGRAKLSAVTVVRIANGHQKTFHVDLKRVLQGEDDSPFYLKPYDIVHVPTKTFNF